MAGYVEYTAPIDRRLRATQQRESEVYAELIEEDWESMKRCAAWLYLAGWIAWAVAWATGWTING